MKKNARVGSRPTLNTAGVLGRFQKIEGYKAREGWTFPWYSSQRFQDDFHNGILSISRMVHGMLGMAVFTAFIGNPSERPAAVRRVAACSSARSWRSSPGCSSDGEIAAAAHQPRCTGRWCDGGIPSARGWPAGHDN